MDVPEVQNAWRHELQKNGIGFNDLVFIGNNLGNLSNPVFIPNVFEVIKLVKSDRDRAVAHERKYRALPKLMTPEEVKELRNKTQPIRESAIKKIQDMLNAS